jgi:DNA-directed RNA polymerase subunit RPC12/RpoP
MATIQIKRDGEIRRLSAVAALLAVARREEVTPYRVRCVTCGKILGEVGDETTATLACHKCARLTLGMVTKGRLVLVDMGPAGWHTDPAADADTR